MQQPSSPSATILYLGNLPFTETSIADFEEIQDSIQQAFHAVDSSLNIFDCKIMDKRDKQGQATIFALISMCTEQQSNFQQQQPLPISQLIPIPDLKALTLQTIKIKHAIIAIEKKAEERDYHLYIKDIGTLKEKSIHGYFSKYGTIDSIETYTKEGSINSCLVRFQKDEAGRAALEQHDHNIEGEWVRAEHFIKKEDRRDDYHRLIVRRIPSETNRLDLQKILTKEFSVFGRLIKPLELEKKEGQQWYHTLVYYNNSKSADDARTKFNKNLFSSEQPLEIDTFIPKKDRELVGQLYVSNLKEDSIDADRLKEVFSTYGEVKSVQLMRGDFKTKTRKAIVVFADRQHVNEAISECWSNQVLRALFIDNKPYLNIYLDRNERNMFIKATKKYQHPEITAPRANLLPPGPVYTYPVMLPGAFNKSYPLIPTFVSHRR